MSGQNGIINVTCINRPDNRPVRRPQFDPTFPSIPGINERPKFPHSFDFNMCITCAGSGIALHGVCIACRGSGRSDNRIIL